MKSFADYGKTFQKTSGFVVLVLILPQPECDRSYVTISKPFLAFVLVRISVGLKVWKNKG